MVSQGLLPPMMPCSLEPVMPRESTSLSLFSRALQNVSLMYCYGYVCLVCVVQSWVSLSCTYVANSPHQQSLLAIYVAYPTQNLSPEFYVHVTVHRNKFIFNKTNRRTNFSKFIFVKKLYKFQAVPLPNIRSSPVYIRQWYMSCRFDDSFRARSRCES